MCVATLPTPECYLLVILGNHTPMLDVASVLLHITKMAIVTLPYLKIYPCLNVCQYFHVIHTLMLLNNDLKPQYSYAKMSPCVNVNANPSMFFHASLFTDVSVLLSSGRNPHHTMFTHASVLLCSGGGNP